MKLNRFTKFVIRSVLGAGALLFGLLLLFLVEQRRAGAESREVLSAFLSETISSNTRGLSSGQSVQIVVQRDAESPSWRTLEGISEGPVRWGLWREKWKLLFDKNLRFPQLGFATRASFIARNIVPSDIHAEPLVPKDVEVIYVRYDEFTSDNTHTFRQLFPKGIGYLAVSQPGINLDRTEAIIYADFFCEGECGSGGYVLMRKTNGAWHVAGTHHGWVS